MTVVVDEEECAALDARLRWLAWRWYRIPAPVAEDIRQAAHLANLETEDRYPTLEEHPAIFLGIFRNKCREHIASCARAERRLRALRDAARAGDGAATVTSSSPKAAGSTLEQLVQREDGRMILEALGEQRPKAREMFRLIVEEGASRADLIRRYGVNKNTFDTRLRSYRGEFRKSLARRGVRA